MKKRLLCGVMALLMMLSITGGQFSQVVAQSRIPTLLSAERLSDLPEGNYVYFGTASANLEESDRYYAIPIYREGDLSSEVSVDVRSLDMTAVYGEDYALYMTGVEVTADGQTLLQSYMEGSQQEVLSSEATVPEVTATESGKLAQLKEEATGEATRDTYTTEAYDLIDSIAQSLMPETIEQMEHSAQVTVTFAPGENEKLVTFRLIDDKSSEGTENFTLSLINPVGAELYSVTSFSASITDDEPLVHSTVSFTAARYDSSKGIATVTVERTGAEYSLVDMRIFTSQDTAKADINYESMNATLAFMPYETKKEIEILVGGEGCFTVLLDDFHACQAGRYTRTKVYICPEDSGIVLMDSTDDTQSFTINPTGKRSLEVRYVEGEPTGKIFDTSYTPALEVGCYYFALSSEKGGYFHYSSDNYSGSKPNKCGTLVCEYVDVSNAPQHQDYGDLKYYHSTTWKNGKVWAYGNVTMPGVYYQYVSVDWEATSDGGKEQLYRLNSTTLNLNDTVQTNNHFDRTQSNAAVTLLNLGNTNYNKMFHVSVDAIDQASDHLPKCYLRFYGVAAMYKTYQISVNEPAKKDFLTGEGGKISTVPVQVELRCGAQDPLIGGSSSSRYIYANPDANQSNLVFSLNSSRINGMEDKFGVITGYSILLNSGTSSEHVTVNYPEDFISYLNKSKGTSGKISNYSASSVDKKISDLQKNLGTVPYDSYFIDWIDSVQKAVTTQGAGYCQHLVFTPKFDYIDVKVEVREPDITGATGSFTDATLSKVGTYTYHAGDELDLRAVCNTDGYHVVGYSYSVDGETTYDVVSSTKVLRLQPQYSHYIIRPVLAPNDNCIEIKCSSDVAQYILGINGQGLVSNSLLEKNGLDGHYVLKLDPNGKDANGQMMPEVGKIYSVGFLTYEKDGKLYVPVITDSTGKKYTTQSYDFIASQRVSNNVLTLTYEPRSSQQTYTITGNLVSNWAPILPTAEETVRLGVSGHSVSLPIGPTTNPDTGATIINNASNVTTDDGHFTLSGISGQSGDRMTMLVSNGPSSQIVEIVLGSNKELDVGEVDMSYPVNAPRVTDRGLQYEYDSNEKNALVDNSDNSVLIQDGEFSITISVNTMGRKVTKAVFTAYTVTGVETDYTAVASIANPGVFTATITKMSESLYNGHRIRVSLVEEVTSTNEDGSTSTHEVMYPAVDTGLVFRVENVLRVPQNYDTSTTPTVEIPLLGSSNASASSGLLGFRRTNWAGNTGYTLTINVDAVIMNSGSLSNKDKLAKYDQLQASTQAAHAAKKGAEAGEAYMKDLDKSVGYIITALEEDVLDSNQVMNIYSSIEDQKERAQQQLERINEAGKDAKNAVSGFSKVKTMKLDILFLLAFDFVYDASSNEYIFCSGSVSIGGSFNYSRSFYTSVYGVPLYLNLTGLVQVDISVYYPNTSNNSLTAAQFNSYAGNIAERLEQVSASGTLLGDLKISVGVGMCNVIGAGGTVDIKIQFHIPLTPVDEFGFMISTAGSLYVDLLVGRFNLDLYTATYGVGVYEGKTGFDYIGENLINPTRQASAGTSSQQTSDAASSLQSYSAGTTDLSGFGANGMLKATLEEVRRTVLLSDAAERTAPQIVELNDGKKMIFFIGNRDSESPLNSRALYWSVYNKGTWSEPQLVADDGTFDASPTVVQQNGKVVVAWVDADGSASGQSTTVEKLNSLGISAAVYKDGQMGSEITLVQDEFFNFAPQLNLVDDTLYCSYMKRDISGVTTEDGLLDMTATYSTMAYVSCSISNRTAQPEQFIVIQHPVLTDPLVMDYHCVTTTVGGENYMLATYTVDEDGNLLTGEDRELFLSIHNLTTDTTYYPIQLTSDQANQALPKLTELDGMVYLSWMEDGSVFNLLNVSDMVDAFFHTDEVGSVYRNSTAAGWHRKSADQLPDAAAESYASSFYDLAARDLFYSSFTNLHPDPSSSISISDYILTTNGDDLYLFYTDFGSDGTNDLSMELYGLRYQRDVDDDGVDEDWGFGLPVKITDYGKVIDEFDLYMTKDNQISMVSNHYKQWIDADGATHQGANQLVQIEFDTRSSLSIVGDVQLPSRLVAGEAATISFDVANNGLMESTGFDVTVLQIKGGAEQTVFTQSYEKLLDSGESCEIEVPWVVPEDVSDTQIKVIVTEHDVAITKAAEAVAEVPYRSILSFSDITVAKDDGGYFLSATVTNLGNANGSAATAQVGIANGTELTKLYATASIPALASGESTQIKLPFTPAPEDFTKLGVIDLTLRAVNGEELLQSGYTKLVSNQPAVVQINNGAERVKLGIGKETPLVTTVAPWDQLAGEVRYTSSDASIAFVDSEGNLHGAAEGNATITAYYPAFGISDTIEVTVTQSSTPDSPATGDSNAPWLWIAPMLLSTAALAILFLFRKKRIL